MRVLLLAFVLLGTGCTTQQEILRMTSEMRERCTWLGGAPKFEQKDGVTVRFTCQLAVPSAWVKE